MKIRYIASFLLLALIPLSWLTTDGWSQGPFSFTGITIKNGTTSGDLQVYNTDDGAGNTEFFEIDWDEALDVVTLGTDSAGTGTKRPMEINALSLGLGTKSAQEALHIQADTPFIRMSDDDATTDVNTQGGFAFWRGNGTSRVFGFQTGSTSNGEITLFTDHTSGYLSFRTGIVVEALRLNSDQTSDFAADVDVTGDIRATATLKAGTFTVATLPTAGGAGAGSTAFVSDGSVVHAGNSGSIVAGSGSNFVPVYSDGTNWRIQ